MNDTSKYLEIDQVFQTFPTPQGEFVALKNINLTVQKGEFVSLIGHSGCGKSTLLNLIAGLTKPSAGTLICANKEITGPGPERGVVFQNHSLLPWLTCFENVYLAVERVFGPPSKKIGKEPESKSSLIEREISGGMKQRVGSARALSMQPQVLVLDEPFGALDALTRAKLQDELLSIVAQTQSTVVMVTHDVDEAVLLSDQIVMLTNGPAATIGDVLTIALPRPRSRLSLAQNTHYQDYRKAVIEFLYTRQQHVEKMA